MVNGKLIGLTGLAGVPLVGIPVQHVVRAGFDWVALVEIVIAAVVAIIVLLKKQKVK